VVDWGGRSIVVAHGIWIGGRQDSTAGGPNEVYTPLVLTRRHHFVLAGAAAVAIVAMWPTAVGMVSDLASRAIDRFTLKPHVSVVRPRARRFSLPALDCAAAWLNGPPVGRDSLAGRPIVIVTFSTTDPRSPMLLRKIQDWHEAYARFGLRVLGVHHPGFAFETQVAVPGNFIRSLGVTFPVALDPLHAIVIENPIPSDGVAQAHPSDALALSMPESGPLQIAIFSAQDSTIYFDGSLRALEALPRADFELRRELDRWRPDLGIPIGARPEPMEGAFTWRFVRLGLEGNTHWSLAGAKLGLTQLFTAPQDLVREGRVFQPSLAGRWMPIAGAVTAKSAGKSTFLTVRYDVDHFDMNHVSVIVSPPRSGRGRLWILSDEAPLDPDSLGEDARLDDRGDSYVDVTESRVYSIARGMGGHWITLSPAAPGITLHAVMFDNLNSMIAGR